MTALFTSEEKAEVQRRIDAYHDAAVHAQHMQTQCDFVMSFKMRWWDRWKMQRIKGMWRKREVDAWEQRSAQSYLLSRMQSAGVREVWPDVIR